MNDPLQNTLRSLIQSGWESNPAMHRIIHDYAKYHAVLVIVGGLFTLILMSLSLDFWIKFKEMPKTGQFKWIFEKKVYFSFGLLAGITALLMGFIVAANATNALNPLHGFSLLIDSFTLSSDRTQLHSAYNSWIQSNSSVIPTLIEQHIHQRVVFHATKAIVCSILMVAFAVLSTRLWSTLIQRRSVCKIRWKLQEKTSFAAGMTTDCLSLLMMVIVIANLQGAVAPITLTLFLAE